MADFKQDFDVAPISDADVKVAGDAAVAQVLRNLTRLYLCHAEPFQCRWLLPLLRE